MTPLLILIFGIQPVTAVGTDIFYGAVTKTAGAWRHLKHGTVHKGIAIWLAVGSVPMAIAGVWLIEILQSKLRRGQVNKVVLGMVGAALLVVGVATLIRALFLRDVIPERYAMHLYRRHIIAAVATGAMTGFVIGLTSAGSGTLIAHGPDRRFRLTPQRVVGTDVFHAADPPVGRRARSLGRRQRRLRPRRQHPRRLDPRGADRGPARGQGPDRAAAKRPRRGPDRLGDRADHQGARADGGADPVAQRRRVGDRGPSFAFQIGLHRQRQRALKTTAKAPAAAAKPPA